MKTLEQKIEKALAIHRRVHYGGGLGNLVLSCTFPAKRTFMKETRDMVRLQGAHFPKPTPESERFRKDWMELPEHNLLQDIIKAGFSPRGIMDIGDLDDMPTYDQLRRYGTQRGYPMPETRPSPETESDLLNAFQTFSEIFHTASGGKRPNFPRNFAVCPQFLVPNVNGRYAYSLDFLHLAPGRLPNEVRLIGIEVDGPKHREPEQAAKDRKRDEYLNSLGYEIWRVCGDWCNVDPYRVVYDFALDAKILSPSDGEIPFGDLNDLGDYTCHLCGEPLIRWDSDWIQGAKRRGRFLPAHSECLHERDQNNNADYDV